jgi:hypothetical protein
LVITGCTVALVVAGQGTALAKRGGTDRPVRGAGSGMTTADLAALTSVSTGTERLSHFGKARYRVEATSIVLTGPTTFTFSGTTLDVAANGDRLTGTFTGSGDLASGESTINGTITGGTGRFANASGTLTTRISSQVVSTVGTTQTLRDKFTVRGRISY